MDLSVTNLFQSLKLILLLIEEPLSNKDIVKLWSHKLDIPSEMWGDPKLAEPQNGHLPEKISKDRLAQFGGSLEATSEKMARNLPTLLCPHFGSWFRYGPRKWGDLLKSILNPETMDLLSNGFIRLLFCVTVTISISTIWIVSSRLRFSSSFSRIVCFSPLFVSSWSCWTASGREGGLSSIVLVWTKSRRKRDKEIKVMAGFKKSHNPTRLVHCWMPSDWPALFHGVNNWLLNTYHRGPVNKVFMIWHCFLWHFHWSNMYLFSKVSYFNQDSC